MDSQKKQTSPDDNGISSDEKQTIKRLFMSLLLTVKNLSLYPPGHTICTKSITQFYTQLKAFLEKYKTFRLEIEREKIICHGVIVAEGVPEEGTLHYTFFRDGIRWIALEHGIEQVEVIDIFLLINKYTKLSAEPAGDIVTAFWEIQFPHMHYEIAELLWEGDRSAEKYSNLVSGKSSLTHYEKPDKREKDYQGDPPIDMRKVMLTPEEEGRLNEMIQMEENADLTSYLDALLDSLLQHREEVNFSKILEALSEEFSFSLARMEFNITLKILQGLQYVQGICREELPWTEKLIKVFFLNVSRPESLAPLKDVWEQIDTDNAGAIKDIFFILDPKTIQVLISLLPKVKAAPQKKMLLDLIILLASRDAGSLELALSSASVNLLERLISVIVSMGGEQSLKYLIKLSDHSSGNVRYEAVKGILKLDPSRVRGMLNLLDDDEDSVRQLVLEQMGRARDNAVEEFLVSYIKKNKSNDIDANYILQCFRILGKCGSSHSVPFLRETLLKWGFLPGSRRAILRRGAAIALGRLDLNEADKILERAGRSLFPGVKSVAVKVMKELNEEEGRNVS